MMFGKFIKMGGATLCCLSASAGHTEEFPNTGDGNSTQFTYVLHGGGVAVSKDGLKTIDMIEGQIVDMTPLMGGPFVGQVSAPSMWVSVNPTPSNIRFAPTVVRESQTIVGTEECYLVCIEGAIKANNKTLETLKFAKIADGQSVSVEIPSGSIALVIRKAA